MRQFRINVLIVSLFFTSSFFVFIILSMNTNTHIQNVSANGSLIYSEDFSSDIFSNSIWTHTDNSVYIDDDNGWLHISSDSNYDDYASMSFEWNFPFTIVISSRSSGGRGYRMPAFEFYNNLDKIFSITAGEMWVFYQATTNTSFVPPSDDIWWDIKVDFGINNQKLYAKSKDNSIWNFVMETNAAVDIFTSLRIRQHWDAIIDVDYIKIYNLEIYEPFISNDIWSDPDWYRSGTYYSVNELEGWLHKDHAGINEDTVDYSIPYTFPFIFEYRGRLTAGGNGYTFPAFHFNLDNGEQFSFVYGYTDNGQWRFLDEYIDSNNGPNSEGIWWSARIKLDSNVQSLYAKSDLDNNWTLVATKYNNLNGETISVGFHASWDSIIDIDYFKIEILSPSDTLSPSNSIKDDLLLYGVYFLPIYLVFVASSFVIYKKSSIRIKAIKEVKSMRGNTQSLCNLVDSNNWPTNLYATKALVKNYSEKSIEKLLEVLEKNESPKMRKTAAKSLYKLKPLNKFENIIEIIKIERKITIRNKILDIMLAINLKKTLNFLIDFRNKTSYRKEKNWVNNRLKFLSRKYNQENYEQLIQKIEYQFEIAFNLVKEGHEIYTRGFFEEAKSKFEEALRIIPDSEKAHEGKAICELAIRLRPIKAYLSNGRDALVNELFVQAESLVKQALEQAEKSNEHSIDQQIFQLQNDIKSKKQEKANHYCELGEKALSIDNFNEAIKLFEAALIYIENYSRAFKGLEEIKLRQEQIQKVSDFIKLNNKSVPIAISVIAERLNLSKKDTIRALKTIIKVQPTFGEYYETEETFLPMLEEAKKIDELLKNFEKLEKYGKVKKS